MRGIAKDPNFCVRRSTSAQVIATATWDQIEYNEIEYDDSRGYDLTKHHFICPVSGVYLFQAANHFFGTPTVGNISRARIYVNGAHTNEQGNTDLGLISCENASVNQMKPNGAVIMRCGAGDAISVWGFTDYTSSPTILDGGRSSFSGVLLRRL